MTYKTANPLIDSSHNMDLNFKLRGLDKKLSLVLIDDDPTYGKVTQKIAGTFGIDVTICSNIEEFARHGHKSFDVAIMDYNLGYNSPATGVELAHYIENVWGEIPTLLVSGRPRIPFPGAWPRLIKKFVNKNQGHQHVLATAVDIYRSENTRSKT